MAHEPPLSRCVDAVEACICGLDAVGEIQFANRFATDRFGSSVCGSALSSLVDERSRVVLTRAIRRANQGTTQRGIETRDRADPQRVFTWTLTPGRFESTEELDGSARATLVAVGLDISEARQLEQRSAERQALALMGNLAMRLAHEIRNPLNSAKLQLELLMRRATRAPHPDDTRDIVMPAALVGTEIERLRSMLDDFLQLARPRQPVRVDCAIRELVEEVIAIETPAAERGRVRLRSDNVEPLRSVRADPDKLKDALINLVRNGIEALAGRGGGEVTVRACSRSGGGVSFEVEDDGPGLPPGLTESAALKPFVTTKPAGTGLGLAIVQKNVAQHGGEVSLRARPGGGTIAAFWIAT